MTDGTVSARRTVCPSLCGCGVQNESCCCEISATCPLSPSSVSQSQMNGRLSSTHWMATLKKCRWDVCGHAAAHVSVGVLRQMYPAGIWVRDSVCPPCCFHLWGTSAIFSRDHAWGNAPAGSDRIENPCGPNDLLGTSRPDTLRPHQLGTRHRFAGRILAAWPMPAKAAWVSGFECVTIYFGGNLLLRTASQLILSAMRIVAELRWKRIAATEVEAFAFLNARRETRSR